jgi:hypothetical protein
MLISFVIYETPEDKRLLCVANDSLECHENHLSELADWHFCGKQWWVVPDSSILGHYLVEADTGRAIATEAAPMETIDKNKE